MKKKPIELDVDYVGSQDPALQPTAEDFAAISRYLQEQKQRRAAAAAEDHLRQEKKAASSVRAQLLSLNNGRG